MVITKKQGHGWEEPPKLWHKGNLSLPGSTLLLGRFRPHNLPALWKTTFLDLQHPYNIAIRTDNLMGLLQRFASCDNVNDASANLDNHLLRLFDVKHKLIAKWVLAKTHKLWLKTLSWLQHQVPWKNFSDRICRILFLICFNVWELRCT